MFDDIVRRDQLELLIQIKPKKVRIEGVIKDDELEGKILEELNRDKLMHEIELE